MKRAFVGSLVFAMLGLMALPAQALEYPSGTASYWKFEEGSGAVIHSSVGNFEGQVIGPTWSTGIVGGSLTFDGVDDYVAFTQDDENGFLNTSPSFSYSVWLKFDSLGGATCEGEDFAAYSQMVLSTHAGPYLYLANTGRLVALMLTSSNDGPYGEWRLLAADTCSWSAGEWYHVAVTLDTSSARMYVNGALASEAPGGEKVTSGDSYGFKLGRMHYLDELYFHGSMDELAILGRALSADEVLQHYQRGLAGLGYEQSYDFDGFSQPVDNDIVNSARAGQAIPVKWRLLDLNGMPISDPASFVGVTTTTDSGACSGSPTDALEQYAALSGLQYLGDGYWQFNWKTPKTLAGQCRTMTLELADGSLHTASFLFK